MKKASVNLGHRYRYFLRRIKTPKSEEGMAMLLALLTGVTLLAGASGLLIRQLMARKLGASESYHQMAEAAAVNGFNRILSELNRNDPNDYRGYLYGLDNIEDDPNTRDIEGRFDWEFINSPQTKQKLEQICTDTSKGLPPHPTSGFIWPTGHDGNGNTKTMNPLPFIKDEAKTQRKDGKSSIQSFYRLRGYSTDVVQGNGTARVEIEGIVKRVDATGEEDFLGKTLLFRTFKVESSIAKDDDWGVIAAKHFDLGATSIDGDGKILWHVNKQKASDLAKSGCTANNLLNQLKGKSATNNNRIWPVMDRDKKSSLSLALFGDHTSKGENIDYDPKKSGVERVWSFDDTGSGCGAEDVVLTRAKNRTSESDIKAPRGVRVSSRSTGRTTLKECTGLTPSDPVFWTATQVCRPYSYRHYKSVCYTGRPTLSRGYQYWFSQESYGDGWTAWIPTPQKEWTVRIHQRDICSGQSKAECHMYIEHMKLENTRVYIENDKRAVVLHLELPPNDSKFKSGVSTGRIELSGNSQLCGVNAGSSQCNNKPESFVISQTNGSESLDCDEKRLQGNGNGNELQSILSIAGNSLPAAWVSLRTGTFTLSGNANMNGVVWANSFCSQNNGLSLSTKRSDGGKGSVVQAADELWQWKANGVMEANSAFLGRTIARGIRGSGLDMFRRW